MDDSVISCPPCRSPADCLGGGCAMARDKLGAWAANGAPVNIRHALTHILVPVAAFAADSNGGWCGNFGDACRCLHLPADFRAECRDWNPPPSQGGGQ